MVFQMKLLLLLALTLSMLNSGISSAVEEVKLERKQVAFFKNACQSDLKEDQTTRMILPAIAAILLPKFLETGIEIGATAIKKAAENKSDAKFVKTDEVNIAKITPDGAIKTNDNNSCLVYFDGYFKGENDKSSIQSDEIKSYCNGIGKCILENAVRSHLVFETKINLNEQRRLKINITKLYFGEPVLNDSFFSSSKERDILITIDFLNYEADKPYGSAAFPLNGLTPKSTLNFSYNDFYSVVAVLPKDSFSKAIEKQNNTTSEFKTKLQTAYPRSALIPVEVEAEKSPNVIEALENYCTNAPEKIVEEVCPNGLGELRRTLIKTRAESVKNINKQRALDWVNEKNYDPNKCGNQNDNLLNSCIGSYVPTVETGLVYAKITTTETKKGSQFWTKVADTLLSTKGDIANTLSKDILLDRDKQKAQELDDEALLLRKLEEAKDNVRLAEAKQLSLSTDASDKDNIEAEIALKKAKMDVNAASRKLGLAKFYPELP